MKDEIRTKLLEEYKMMKKVLDGLNEIDAIKEDKKEKAEDFLIEQVLEGKDIESTEEIYSCMEIIDGYTRSVNEFTEDKYKPLYYLYKNLESGELKIIHVSAKKEFERNKIIIYPKKGDFNKEKFYKDSRIEYFKHVFSDGEDNNITYIKRKNQKNV